MTTVHAQTKSAHAQLVLSLGVSLTGVVANNHLGFLTTIHNDASLLGTAPTSSPSATWANSIVAINTGGFNVSFQADYSENVASGSWTVTGHCSTSAWMTVVASESSGVATSSSLGATNSHSSASAGTVQAGSITPAAGSIVYAYCTDEGSLLTADTINQSFVIQSAEWDRASHVPAGVATLENVAGTALNPTWTLPASATSAAAIVEFKAAPAAATSSLSQASAGPAGATASVSATTAKGAWTSIRPVADVSTGTWTDQSYGTSDLHSPIGEIPFADTTYDQAGWATSDVLEERLHTFSIPSPANNFTFSYRYNKDYPEGQRVDLQVELRQGASTQVAVWTHTSISGTVTEADQALTAPQIALITDPTDVRVRVTQTRFQTP